MERYSWNVEWKINLQKMIYFYLKNMRVQEGGDIYLDLCLVHVDVWWKEQNSVSNFSSIKK